MSEFDAALRLREKIADVGSLLIQAAQMHRALSEADTEHIIIDPLLQSLGYSPLEVTKRRQDGATGTFPDYTLLDDTPHRWFLEAKRLDLPLHDREAMQAVVYASNHGATWAVLTNGRAWYFYLAHLQKPLNEKRVFQIDDLFADPAHSVETLRLLSRASMMGDGLTKEYTARLIRSRLHDLVRSELTNPLSATRKALRKTASAEIGVLVTDEAIGDTLQALFAAAPDAAPEASTPAATTNPPATTAPVTRRAAPIANSSPSPASNEPKTPPGDWKTLNEMRRDTSLTTGRKPTRVLLGGKDIRAVKSWSELAQFVMQFLGETYGLPTLPYTLSGKGKKYLLNREPIRADGKTMFASAKIVVSEETVYVDTHASASSLTGLLCDFANARNAPLDAVRVEVSPRSGDDND